MNSRGLLIFLIAFLFVLNGCGIPTSSSIPQIQIQILSTEMKDPVIFPVPQPNCNGSAEVENQYQYSKQITNIIEIQDGIQVSGEGKIGVLGTDVGVGTVVSKQFGQSYGVTETITRSITVKASPGTDMEHTLRMGEIWKNGSAKITFGGEEKNIPFSYRYDFGIELVGSKDKKDCPTLGTNSPTSQAILTKPANTQIATLTTLNSRSTQCEFLRGQLPQSSNDVIVKFGFPTGTTIQFLYELCPTIANGFAFKSPSAIELQVPNGGCVDSWSGFTKYVGDVGTPVEDGFGGWRVYKGSVRAPEMTYRLTGCN
jgi:hypothetical protein